MIENEFKIHKNEHDELEGCSYCGCEVPLNWFLVGLPYSETNKSDTKHLLCEICASTSIGNGLRNGRDPNYEVAKMLAQLGNHLKFKQPKGGE